MPHHYQSEMENRKFDEITGAFFVANSKDSVIKKKTRPFFFYYYVSKREWLSEGRVEE